MRKMKFVYLILMLLSLNLQAQVPGEQRGLYVNRFVSLIASGTNEDDIDVSTSILTNSFAETQLLQYCMENHITYISLYGLRNIFYGSPTQVNSKILELQRFICMAKTDYCIEHVGSAGAFEKLDVDPQNPNDPYIGNNLRPSNPFIFDSLVHGTSYYDDLSFIEESIQSDDERYEVAENCKLALRLINMGNRQYFSGLSSAPCNRIDILTTEWEFWNGKLFDDQVRNPERDNDDYNDLIFLMDKIRDNHSYEYFVEGYLSKLEASNTIDIGLNLYPDPCSIASYIDGSYTTSGVTRRILDRILADNYSRTSSNNPAYNPAGNNNVYNQTSRTSKYLDRFLRFSESIDGSNAAPAPTGGGASANACLGPLGTNNATDYHPIFAANSVKLGAASSSNFLGDYLKSASNINIFTVERDYYDVYLSDAVHNVHGQPQSNRVNPGACQWYAQNYMVKPLDHPITFLAYTDPCPSSGSTNLRLVYQGPIEDNIQYEYVVLNSLNQPQTVSPGVAASGSNPLYSSVGGGLQPVHYNLSNDTYKISLILTYKTGCHYTYEQKIVVSDHFSIQALNSNPLSPGSVCEGSPVFLQANWYLPTPSSSPYNFQWYLNGSAIQGARDFNFTATQTGIYFCTFNNGTCSETSNSISVTINANPFTYINVNCGGASICSDGVTLTAIPYISTSNYQWSNGAFGQSTEICSEGTISLTVIGLNGCVSNFSKNISDFMFNTTYGGNTPNIVQTSPTGNPCPGKTVHLSVTTSNSLSQNVIWSTGETTNGIDVNNGGVYTAILIDENGCEAIDSYQVNYNNSNLFNITSADPLANCTPASTIHLEAPQTGFQNYQWFANGTAVSGVTSYNYSPSPTTTTVYSVTATGTGTSSTCNYTATVTAIITTELECLTIKQAAVPTVTYAGYPVKFTVEVCNNSAFSHTVVITDGIPPSSSFHVINNPLATPLTVTLPPGPYCETFVIEGYFTLVNNFCPSTPPASHTNYVSMQEGANTPIDAGEECIRVLATCPLITYANGDCAEESIVDVCLGVHKTIANVQFIDLSLVYPAFLEPPLAGALTSTNFSWSAGTIDTGSTIGTPMTSTSIGGVSYMEVPIRVAFSPGVTTTYPNGPNEFFCLKFKNNGAPGGMNQFKLFDSDYNTAITTSGDTFQFYTQASSVYLHNCTDIPSTFDASFRITRTGCSKPGEITVTADEDSANVIHIWDFGDVRRTPERGAPATFTWDYFADYTDNTSSTESRANGNYTFTITHTIIRGNISYVDTQIVAITGKLDGSVTPTDNVCLSPNFGTATVSPIYGTAPYTYSWSTGANTATVNGLTAGNHTVTITDDSLCTKVINITVATPDSSSGPSCVTVTPVNTSCITATKLTWTAAISCLKGYDVTVWSGSGTPNYLVYHEDVGTDTAYSLLPLLPATTYYYKVVPYDFRDSLTLGCSTGSFTSGTSQAVSPTLSSTITLGAESASVPALPCGMLVENYDQQGASSWYTSTTAPRTGSNHMRIDKNPDNVTALSDWFFSPPINVTKGHAYRVSWYDRIASGTSAETYKVYIGTSADASTLLGDGPLFNGISSNTTYHKDSAIDYLATSSGQIYFGFYATSLANQGSIYIDDIQIKEIQVTRVDTTYCNTTLSSTNLIYAYSVSGVSNYKYKFVGTGGQSGYNFEHGTSNSNTSFYPITQAPGVIYGYTYNVSVSYKKNNIWSPYGASCPVTLSAFPQNKLVDNPSTPGLCDYIVTDQHELINVTPITGASKYQYKIVENDTTNSYVYDTTSTTFNSVDELRLDMAAITPKVRYGYYYNVKVRALVGSTNSTYGSRPGEWGTFGPTCVVNVSGLPTTSLTTTYCNTNQTTLNDIFYVTPISSASQYRYHITASGYDNTIETSNSNSFFRFTSINPAVSPGGVKYGTTYSIEAAAAVGGAWLPYGSTCTLTTPTAPLTKLQTSQCNTSISSGSTFLYWDAIYGASNYQYKVSGTFSNGYRTREIYRNSSNNFFILSWANQTGSSILANQTYYVQVKYYAGQWEAYGDSCSITTNSNYSRYIDSLEAESPSLAMLSMNVYPNPNPYHSEFSVELNGIKEKNQKVDLFIFNSEGASVYRAAIVSKEENRIVIKPQVDLAPGVYIVLSDVNGVRLQKKFVVE
ncbi:MAG: hypothetical protein IPP32_02750 [Bacteroidetes bacterium]|nr:hypothetical protein [Bacteroidota bacterium]